MGVFGSSPDFRAGSGSALVRVSGSGSAFKIQIRICRPTILSLKVTEFVRFYFVCYHLVLSLDELELEFFLFFKLADRFFRILKLNFVTKVTLTISSKNAQWWTNFYKITIKTKIISWRLFFWKKFIYIMQNELRLFKNFWSPWRN